MNKTLQQHLPFTVLKHTKFLPDTKVMTFSLQQHLPFTVLKPVYSAPGKMILFSLQQHLPFTVLKLSENSPFTQDELESCNSTYRLRY